MENLKIQDYTNFIKDFTIERLLEVIDYDFYICDLSNELTSDINVNGSYTFSTYLAKQYIKEWFNEAGKVYEYQKNNYGEVLYNPFENPEAFHVCMIIEGVNALLNSCEFIQENWDNEVELTEDIVNTLIAQIKIVNEIEF